jgi:hypothetical protein
VLQLPYRLKSGDAITRGADTTVFLTRPGTAGHMGRLARLLMYVIGIANGHQLGLLQAVLACSGSSDAACNAVREHTQRFAALSKEVSVLLSYMQSSTCLHMLVCTVSSRSTKQLMYRSTA